ncbi:MAG: PQQ-binding-like beta-propeller repeat protein [Aureliella sp.]
MISNTTLSPLRSPHSAAPSMLTFAILVSVLANLLSANCLAEETSWGRLRGPNGAGVVENCSVPLPWNASHIKWQIELLGTGCSSPVVAGDRIFIMSGNQDSAERHLQAFDLNSGEQAWSKSFKGTRTRLHKKNKYGSSTPCATADAVYFAWGSDEVTLLATDHDGTELWKRNLGRFISQHGFGASPTVVDGKVILFNSQAAQQLPPGVDPGVSRVMAFDAKTGEDVWQTPRTTTRTCYGVPAAFKDPVSGRDALLFANTGDGMFALDLENGKQLWNNPVFAKRSVSCPIVVGDLGIGSEGSGGGGNIVYAVNLKDPSHKVAFTIERAAAYVPSPIAYKDLLFTWSDKGIVGCVSLPNGKLVWNKRVGGNFSSSPVVADGKLIGISEDGVVTILAASHKFEKIGEVKLGEDSSATPLVARDYLLIRTEKHLMRIGK